MIKKQRKQIIVAICLSLTTTFSSLAQDRNIIDAGSGGSQEARCSYVPAAQYDACVLEMLSESDCDDCLMAYVLSQESHNPADLVSAIAGPLGMIGSALVNGIFMEKIANKHYDTYQSVHNYGLDNCNNMWESYQKYNERLESNPIIPEQLTEYRRECQQPIMAGFPGMAWSPFGIGSVHGMGNAMIGGGYTPGFLGGMAGGGSGGAAASGGLSLNLGFNAGAAGGFAGGGGFGGGGGGFGGGGRFGGVGGAGGFAGGHSGVPPLYGSGFDASLRGMGGFQGGGGGSSYFQASGGWDAQGNLEVRQRQLEDARVQMEIQARRHEEYLAMLEQRRADMEANMKIEAELLQHYSAARGNLQEHRMKIQGAYGNAPFGVGNLGHTFGGGVGGIGFNASGNFNASAGFSAGGAAGAAGGGGYSY